MAASIHQRTARSRSGLPPSERRDFAPYKSGCPTPSPRASPSTTRAKSRSPMPQTELDPELRQIEEAVLDDIAEHLDALETERRE